MELKLPKNYVEIDQNEMMYIDGGFTVYNNWWGTSVKFSKKECRKIRDGASLAAIGAGGIPGASASFALLSLFASQGAQGNGLYLNRTWVGQLWVSW